MKQHHLFSAAALLGMLAIGLLSCGSAGTQDTVTTAPTGNETTPVGTDAVTADAYILPEKDMEGWALSVLNYNEAGLSWANIDIVMEESDGDILNDALYNRNIALTDKYNCQILVDESGDVDADIRKLVMAGDTQYNVYISSEARTFNAYLPYIQDWNNIPHLSLDKPWWNPNATSVYKMGGKQLALAGNQSLSAVSRAVCMVFNKNIWTQYGNPDINLYDLVAENTWTVDKFIEVNRTVSQDLNGDGTMDENDLYGLNMGRGFKGYIASFLAGSGMNFTGMDESGMPVFTLHENETAIQLIASLIDALSYEGFYYNEDTSVHGFAPADFFKNGHALFTQGVPHDIYKLRDMEDDVGILPMPKLDASQESYYAAAWGGATWCLPTTFDLEEADNMGILLEAMAYTTYRDVLPVYKEVALKTKTARDNESEEMLDIIFDSIYFDFGTNILYDSILANGLLTDWWKKKSSDVLISSIEKHLPKIEKYIVDMKEAVDEIE